MIYRERKPGEKLVTIGKVSIPYEVVLSSRARKRRIEVHGHEGSVYVTVIVPKNAELDGDDGVHAYVARMRQWIYDAVHEVERAQPELLPPQPWTSGAAFVYRGRHLTLDVRSDETAERSSVRVRGKRLEVTLRGSRWGDNEQRAFRVRDKVLYWLQERARREIARYGKRYSEALGVEPKSLRLGGAKGSWGSCGKHGDVLISSELIRAPAPAMEYVVAHELTHLLERNHSARFWQLLGEVMPDWQARKNILESWETGPRRKV